jgi:hypothetical protein
MTQSMVMKTANVMMSNRTAIVLISFSPLLAGALYNARRAPIDRRL